MHKTITSILLVLVTIISIYTLIKQNQLCNELNKEQASRSHEEEDFEVANIMGKFQYFSHKLWLAGKKDNWKLAGFYTYELEEAMEELEHADVVDEGKNLSNLVKIMAVPALEEVASSIQTEDSSAFKRNYQILITACNNCHAAIQHEFIRIKIPEEFSSFRNQVFEVQ